MLRVLAVVIAYLIGGINSAYLISKYIKKIDVRNYGSGNAGATNVMRILGVKAAVFVFLLDVLKGIIAVSIGRYLCGETGALLSGIAVVCGHNWPIFLNFKGGKGIATSLGVILIINPLFGIYSLIAAILVIAITKYVSLGSILGSLFFLLLNLIYWKSFSTFLFALIMMLLAVFQHRSNIKRLFSGTELKLGQKTRVK
ncbi:glycerol-3-phosphate acyltransferase [Aceticella autotrophica]|uniref:Glycerol-3-phosphate acyltransferase n=1 Tax=Aceticella autotrophica TaxID=2755338 RepID=A0A975AWV4_9THEO|nr:glycerol-3-phosphate 1-O-acyltransferase PlsY [Aceticella autotrophica]QSZ27946.1 glycerol-3-phosphate acyltransferase [Aceticella autotrophica]